jgi:hypothetical protein
MKYFLLQIMSEILLKIILLIKRAAMLNSMLYSLQNLYGTNNYSVLLYTLSKSQLDALYPLFIEAK